MVLEHVRRKYNKEYKARGMLNVLRKVGFSPKKPRPANAKRASKKEIESFKKIQGDSSEGTPRRDSRSSFWTRRL
jgi:transposase